MTNIVKCEKPEGLPEYDESIQCSYTECREIEAQVLTGMYGMFGGGGPGAYTMCEHCGTVLSKTCDTHEEPYEPTEIKTPDVQIAPSDKP